MKDWLIISCVFAGSLSMLVAGIGFLRFPDLYSRMHSSTKAPTLAILLLFIAAIIHFGSWSVFFKALFTLSVIFLTTPVVTHMVAKVSHLMRTPKHIEEMWDDLEKRQEEEDKNT